MAINAIFIILSLSALLVLLNVQAQTVANAATTASSPNAWLNALNVLPFAAALLVYCKRQKWLGMITVVLNALWLLMFLFVLGSAAHELVHGNSSAWVGMVVSVCIMAVCSWNLKQAWQVATQNERFL